MESLHHYVLIFELMEGGDLWGYQKNLVYRRGSSDSPSGGSGLPPMALKEEEARAVFHQIVSGIAYAHNQHICHRDLKLENILLKNKNLDIVKIADFGLSAFYRPGTNIQTNCGTLSFLAPEVFKGTSNAGPPLDVWALGVILFAMLCGRLPFEGTDLSYSKRPKTPVIRSRIIKCQYKIDESLSPEVKDLVRRMLRLEPAERATVPEIFNHFWLRGAGNVTEIKRDRSATNLNGTVFSTSVKDSSAAFSRESSDRSVDQQKTSSPRSPAIESNKSIKDLAINQIIDALESVDVPTGDSLDQVMMPSGLSSEPPGSKVFKLVPLRRNTGLESEAPDSSQTELSNSTTRRARAMLSDETDSLKDLTDTVSLNKGGDPSSGSNLRFARVRSQPSNSSTSDFAGVGFVKDDLKRASTYKLDDLAPPSQQNSPKGTVRASSTFFSAANASLNTHLGASLTTSKRSSLYDQTSSSNGKSPMRDFK